MNTEEILKFCRENGLLLDSEILKLFSETTDADSIKMIIEKIKNYTPQRIITKEIFSQNKDLERIFLTLPNENQKSLEKLKIKLGLSIEISREKEEPQKIEIVLDRNQPETNARILSSIPSFTGKPEVGNFVKYYRSRFNEMRNLIQANPRLNGLVSINKLSGKKQGVSIIGMVSSKATTKNGNIILDVEDLTGRTKALINSNKPELYKEAEDIALDSVIGLRGMGDDQIIFVNDIIFPDSMLHERKRSDKEEYALFLGDLHFGSKLFREKSFNKFIDYINGKLPDTPEVEKIKTIFLVGDIIAGIGNYPTQEKDLKIIDLEEQFSGFSELIKKMRKDITFIISPGNHDGVRLMEPQPLFDEKYAWNLYDLKNVILTGNPASVNIGSTKNFSGFDVLTYHGFSFYHYANTVPKLMTGGALNAPEKIMAYLLKNRHLAPTHSSVQYFPFNEDYLLIKKIPDIFVSGHTHKSAVSYYNNVLMISTATWESMTVYQEKMGNKPDYCKVPMMNLKTREIKILDFEEKEDEK
ncbi:MAG: metallophosphoesterase [Nanoarchaeota archaeon]|nr:metallophosphoesterase [Nanoarchaeota archaeon]